MSYVILLACFGNNKKKTFMAIFGNYRNHTRNEAPHTSILPVELL